MFIVHKEFAYELIICRARSSALLIFMHRPQSDRRGVETAPEYQRTVPGIALTDGNAIQQTKIPLDELINADNLDRLIETVYIKDY